MDELKKCPFCGGIGSIRSAPHDESDTEYWIVCHSCAAQGGWAKNKNGAIRMWDSRHLTPVEDDSEGWCECENVETIAMDENRVCIGCRKPRHQ